jgi:hypothetical protein
MLALRGDGVGAHNQMYVYFCDKFLKCIVGNQKFKRQTSNGCRISDIATATNEALGLPLLENSEHKWTMEFERKENGTNQEEREREALGNTKYTSAGRNINKKGYTKRYMGWTQNGIDRFNAILEVVKKDRSKNSIWFDKIMDQHFATKNEMKGMSAGDQEEKEKSMKRARAGNDLWDDSNENLNRENVAEI